MTNESLKGTFYELIQAGSREENEIFRNKLTRVKEELNLKMGNL